MTATIERSAFIAPSFKSQACAVRRSVATNFNTRLTEFNSQDSQVQSVGAITQVGFVSATQDGQVRSPAYGTALVTGCS